MGLNTPEVEHLPERIRESDERILSAGTSFSPNAPATDAEIPHEEKVPVGHLVRVCHETSFTPGEVAARLRELGYRAPSQSNLPEQFDQRDLMLTSWTSADLRIWQDPYKPVSLGNLIRAAIRCRIGILAAAERMTELDFTIPDLGQEIPPLIAKLTAAHDLFRPKDVD
jgi:hypothetical protein